MKALTNSSPVIYYIQGLETAHIDFRKILLIRPCKYTYMILKNRVQFDSAIVCVMTDGMPKVRKPMRKSFGRIYSLELWGSRFTAYDRNRYARLFTRKCAFFW